MGGKLIIVADAGGTKTKWWVRSDEMPSPEIVVTSGINAAISSDNDIKELVKAFMRQLSSIPGLIEYDIELFFYGAGCNSEHLGGRLKELFAPAFDNYRVSFHFYSDMLGAARALYGTEKGIAAIIGTGSCTAFFNGNEISDAVPSLGYVLGDEGSGAFMGKKLLNMLFKRELSDYLKVELETFKDVKLSNVISMTYRSEAPNAYLASFVPFIKNFESDPQISSLIDESLKLFFEKNVLKYRSERNETLRFVGSVAALFADRISGLGKRYGYRVDKFLSNPIMSLGEFHFNNRI